MTETVFAADELCAEYQTAAGTVAGLAAVTFELARGRTLGVLGESGSGKSTLIHALLGLLPPNAQLTGGRILFGGVDLVAAGPSAFDSLRGVSIAAVFQDVDAVWDEERPAGESLIAICGRTAASHAQARSEANQLLERLGVGEASACLSAAPSELALGVQQRLLLAMALACTPELLILDCPTSLLDVLSQARVLRELQAIQADLNMAILVASNDPNVLAQLAHDLLVLHAGEVVEHGPADRVLGHSAHPYTQALLASWKTPDRVHIPMLSIAVEPRGAESGCQFAPRCERRLAMGEADRCRRETPLLEEHSSGTRVRCFFPIDS